MLTEIRSDVFRERVVTFKSGLNVVLGDSNGSNSIGKSSLLMIVDFAFGGNSLFEYQTDLVGELGHHDYQFSFLFGGEAYKFRRGSRQPDVVYPVGEDGELRNTLEVAEYTAFLHQAYKIDLGDISFRSLVGLYARVWGKKNLDVHKPLHSHPSQSGTECINNLIGTFDRYGPIRDLTTKVNEKERERGALTSAFRHSIVQKIGKRKHKANAERILQMEREVEEIRADLAKYATNIQTLVNKEILQLKLQKDSLLSSKLMIEGKLANVRRNIEGNRHIRSAHFHGLVQYFPEIDQSRLTAVEEFHSRLAVLLRAELKSTERELDDQLERVSNEIYDLDARMASALSSIDKPDLIVNRVYDLANSLTSAKSENQIFEKFEAFKLQLIELKAELELTKSGILKSIQDQLNLELRRVVAIAFGEERKSPRIELRESGYSFEVFEDTGTGTAYAGLIDFDLAVFRLTRLPVVVHDSILFKNIENNSVARLLSIYAKEAKQSFIALDEGAKYGKLGYSLLLANAVVKLDNEHVLFFKDWRK